MAINISSFLNKSSGSVQFLMQDVDLRGGFRIVADATVRDAIPAGARVAGMLVFVAGTNTMYQLVGGVANANFVVYDATANVTVGAGLVKNAGVISTDATYLNTLYSQVGHGHVIADVTNLQTTLDSKASGVHDHPMSDITDVAVSGPLDKDMLQWNATMSRWENETLANAGISAVGHGHVIADTTGLQTTLDSKSAIGHGHVIADVTNLQTSLDGKAPTAHNHIINDVTGLQTALDGKSATTHNHTVDTLSDVAVAAKANKDLLQWNSTTSKWENETLATAGVAAAVHVHAIADVTNLQTTLDSKASGVHIHAIADTTGLQTALDSKSATTHNHEIDSLSNVTIASKVNKDLLQWNSTSSKWENETLANAGVAAVVHTHAISDTTGLQAELDSKSATTHTHTFASLTAVPQVTAMPGVTISANEPGVGDGVNGDLWFVIP
jgi:hypothetical protein